jgi:hypothetical protein
VSKARSQTRKAKPVKDRNAEFLDHLKQYDDWKSYDAKKFPRDLPFQIPIKIRANHVASVFVDWQQVCVSLLGTTLEIARPQNESDADFEKRLQSLLANASPEARRAFFTPTYTMAFHVFEYLPQQLKESFLQLLAEGYREGMTPIVARRGWRMERRSDFADDMLKRQRKLILDRLPRSKPLNTRTKPRWKDPSTLIAYARLVNSRKLLSETIKKTYDMADGADDWRDDLVGNNDYQLLKTSVLTTALEWALRRVAEDVPKRDREPLALACEIARREMDLEKQQPQTLRTYYTKGAKLLKKR